MWGPTVDVMGVPLPIVWAIAMAIGCATLAILAVVARAQRADPAPADDRIDLQALRAEAQQLAAHAAASHERARQAAAEARRLRERAAAAAAARDVAWQVQEAADAGYRAALQEAIAGRRRAEAMPRRRVGDGGERDRTVSRAALSAYRRGDISVEQLREVWERTGGWDPEQVRRERAAEQAGIAERVARRGFDNAAADARRAEQDARIAEIAAQALADEAAQAAIEAHETMLALDGLTPARSGRLRRTKPTSRR
jgi:hypothetical protein